MDPDYALLRILDANANRAGEGLRVIEEYLRFVVEDPGLARRAKEARHTLAETLQAPELAQRWRGRDAAGDVGAVISTPSEAQRDTSRDVAAASFQRVTQALRSLEEYSKPLCPPAASKFEQLRYQSYQLEAAVQQLSDSQQRLRNCRLYVLADGCDSLDAFTERVEAILAGGVDVIQLRDKRLGDRDLLQRAEQLAQRARGRALSIINDRVDIAVAAQADGVHLGQDDMQPQQARRMLRPDQLVGVSTHNLQQLRTAVQLGASYLGCGPTFPSRTKKFESFSGLGFLQQAIAETALPFFAIGGIDADQIAALRAQGVNRVAVSAAVWGADDPHSAALTLSERLV